MECFWSSEIDSILNVGRPLADIGVRNWALSRQSALSALGKLSKAGVAVLGGDVYLLNGTNVMSNYDNWFCDREGGEPDADFVGRSIAKARRYIRDYQAHDEDILFAIVPKV